MLTSSSTEGPKRQTELARKIAEGFAEGSQNIFPSVCENLNE